MDYGFICLLIWVLVLSWKITTLENQIDKIEKEKRK